MDWKTKLVERYPHLFSHPAYPNSASGYPDVGDGWRLIVEKAIERIDLAVHQELKDARVSVRIAQIKEKLGGLRLYIHYVGLRPETEEKIREAIDLAEARADLTCELCGALGRLHDRAGWYLTRCVHHAEGDPVPEAQGDAGLHIDYAMVGGHLQVVRRRRYDRDRDVFINEPLAPDEPSTDDE